MQGTVPPGNARRVLMIGLDSLDAGLLSELLAEGELPNLQVFASGAERLTVHSKGDVLHGATWPTFSTATNAGTHGVYFWVQWLAEEMRHVRNNHPAFAITPWWAELANVSGRATVIDVPYISPVMREGFRTYMGWGLHDEVQVAAVPAAFKERVDKIAGKSPLTADTMEPQSAKAKLKMVRDMRLSVDKRCKIIIELAAERDWDLFLVTFSEFHKAGHYLSAPAQLSPRLTNRGGMAEMMKAFDRRLPAILEAAGGDCQVFIFALHGMRQQVDFSAFGQQLLALQAGKPAVDPATRPDLVRRIRNAVPDPVHRFIWRHLPSRVRANRQHQLSTGHADLEHDALLPIVHDGHSAVRVNLLGRERDGFVSKEEGARLLDELQTQAAGFRTPEGLPAFPTMWRSDVEEPGPRSHRLPDGLLVANREVVRATTIRNGEGVVLTSINEEVRDGVHTAGGFCFFRGAPGVEVTRQEIDSTDFGPTVLQLLGVETTTKFDGASFVAMRD